MTLYADNSVSPIKVNMSEPAEKSEVLDFYNKINKAYTDLKDKKLWSVVALAELFEMLKSDVFFVLDVKGGDNLGYVKITLNHTKPVAVKLTNRGIFS